MKVAAQKSGLAGQAGVAANSRAMEVYLLRWGLRLIVFGLLARLGLAAGLPEPKKLERICRSIAMLEAIVSPDWESRYYSFDCHFAAGQRLASMRDSSGDDWFILYAPTPLTQGLITSLNPKLKMVDLRKDIEDIGY